MVSWRRNIYPCLFTPGLSHTHLQSVRGEHTGLSLLTLSSMWGLSSTEEEAEYKDP